MTRKAAIRMTTLVLALVFALSATTSMAETRGKIKGKVTGKDGKPIADVKITMQSLKLDTDVYTTTTDKDGGYVYVGVKPVVYKITMEKEGYQPYMEPEFKLRVGVWVMLDVTLLTKEEAQKQFEDTSMTPEQKAAKKYNDAMDAYGKGETDAAIALLQESVSLNPNLAKAHEKLGVLYFVTKKDTEKAKASFQAAAAADSTAPGPYEYLGEIANQAGDTAKAQEYWKSYFDLGGANGAVAENLAVIYIKKEDYKQARAAMEKGVEADPEFAPLYKKLGELCMQKLNDFPAAITNYKKYLEVKPDAPDKNVITILVGELEKAVKKEQEKKGK